MREKGRVICRAQNVRFRANRKNHHFLYANQEKNSTTRRRPGRRSWNFDKMMIQAILTAHGNDEDIPCFLPGYQSI